LRVTENITYQSSRTVKRTHMSGGVVKKVSLAVLVDQAVQWERDKTGYKRVLIPPPPEKLKVIHDVVAGVIGYSAERGDQITVETLPFESTLSLEPPPLPPAMVPAGPPPRSFSITWPPKADKKQMMIGAGVAVGVLVLLAGLIFLARKRAKRKKATATGPGALAGGHAGAAIAGPGGVPAAPGSNLEAAMEAQIAQQEALQAEAEAKALSALKIRPVITKTAEVLAKHLRDTLKKTPEVPAHIIRSWIREEDI
jgi:flagellar M-ring protein FliF